MVENLRIYWDTNSEVWDELFIIFYDNVKIHLSGGFSIFRCVFAMFSIMVNKELITYNLMVWHALQYDEFILHRLRRNNKNSGIYEQCCILN